MVADKFDMTRVIITASKVVVAVGYLCLVWYIARLEWNPPPLPSGIVVTTGVGEDYTPEMAGYAVFGGILAYWLTANSSRRQKGLGILIAAAVLASPFVLPKTAKILELMAYRPSGFPEYLGDIWVMFLTVVVSCMLSGIGWSGAWTGRKFGRFLMSISS